MPKRIFLIPLVSILLFSIFVWQSLPVQDCDPCPDTDSIQDSYQCDDSVTFGVVKTRRTLLINSVLFGAMALGALGTFVILPMMFDAPGTEHDPTVWGCVVMVLALPMMAFISITCPSTRRRIQLSEVGKRLSDGRSHRMGMRGHGPCSAHDGIYLYHRFLDSLLIRSLTNGIDHQSDTCAGGPLFYGWRFSLKKRLWIKWIAH